MPLSVSIPQPPLRRQSQVVLNRPSHLSHGSLWSMFADIWNSHLDDSVGGMGNSRRRGIVNSGALARSVDHSPLSCFSCYAGLQAPVYVEVPVYVNVPGSISWAQDCLR